MINKSVRVRPTLEEDNKDIHMSGIRGDVIGVGVSDSSGNIIGKEFHKSSFIHISMNIQNIEFQPIIHM